MVQWAGKIILFIIMQGLICRIIPGLPDYEENEDFYQSIGVSENAQKVFKSYSYCLYDDFSTETIEKIYNYQKTQELQLH